MLRDDIELIDSVDLYEGRTSSDIGDAWERIKKNIQMLRSALIGLVGASDKCTLEQMEAFTRAGIQEGTVPKKDGTGVINAIHAIIETEDDS